MPKPLNIRGDTSEAYTTNASKSYPLGTRMHTQGQRVFRYARAGSSALTIGRVMQIALQDFEVRNISVTSPPFALYQNTLFFTLPNDIRRRLIAADDYADGMAYVISGTGAGYIYPIVGNTAFSGNTTPGGQSPLRLTFDFPTQTIIDSTSRFTLVKNKFDSVLLATTARLVAGVTTVAVPANRYFWLQTGGPCLVLQQDELLDNLPVTASNLTRGAVEAATHVVPSRQDNFGSDGASGYVRIPSIDQSIKERLALASGAAVVQGTNIGICINSSEHGQFALVWLTLES